MRRILIVNVNWLGDCVMTLPLFKAVKDRYPYAYVAVMTVPRVKEVFQGNPYIDEIIEFDEKNEHKSVFARIWFINYLRKKKFDAAFFIHRSFTRAFICWLSGIKVRVGFERAKTSLILNRKIPPPQGVLHRGDYYFSLFERSRIPVRERIPEFYLSENERSEAREYLSEYKRRYKYLFGVNPSANWEFKRWPLKYFIKVINELGPRGVCVFLIGAEKEKALSEEIIAGASEADNGDVVNLCGKTTLRQLAALLEGMDMILSSDSGPAHLAASLSKRVLVLFGPTSPKITAPRGNDVQILRKDTGCKIPCYNSRCRDNICMKEITPKEVLDNIEKVFKNG